MRNEKGSDGQLTRCSSLSNADVRAGEEEHACAGDKEEEEEEEQERCLLCTQDKAVRRCRFLLPDKMSVMVTKMKTGSEQQPHVSERTIIMAMHSGMAK